MRTFFDICHSITCLQVGKAEAPSIPTGMLRAAMRYSTVCSAVVYSGTRGAVRSVGASDAAAQ